jgi:hypothetical protein
MSTWQIEGEYMETCNCDFLCPCITSNLAAKPTEGDCKAAIAMRIDKGQKDGISLDGLCLIVLIQSDGPMGNGNLRIGLIIDEKADDDQSKAIADISTGVAGGPMEALGPLVGEMVGIERRPISFEIDGDNYSVKAGELVEQSIEAVISGLESGGPIVLENVLHPVTDRLALAHARKSTFNAFGIEWDDASGLKNGHFAEFSWAA